MVNDKKSLMEYLLAPQDLRYAMMSTTTVGLLSKVLGYGRYILLASAFGLSAELDAFYMGMSLMEITVFILGNMSDVLGIPQLVRVQQNKDQKYFGDLTGLLVLCGLLFSVIGLVLSFAAFRPLMHALAPGFSSEKVQLTWSMLPYFIPMGIFYVPFCSLNAVLKSLRRFRMTVLADFTLSLCSLAVLLFTYRRTCYWVPISLGAGYLMAFLVELVSVLRLKAIRWPKKLWFPELKSLGQNAFTLFLLMFVSQSYRVIDKSFASLLPTGNITAIGFTLAFVAPIVTTLSYGGVLLTGFAEAKESRIMVQKGLLLVLVTGLPIVCFMFANSQGLIQFLLKRGAFDFQAVEFTGTLLSRYALIIPASLSIGVVFSYFQASNRLGITAGLGILGMLLNTFFNFLFTRPWGAVGIVWASVISSYIVLILGLGLLKINISMIRQLFINAIAIGSFSLLVAWFVYWMPLPFIVRVLSYFSVISVVLIYFDVPQSLNLKSTVMGLLPKRPKATP